MIKKIRDFFKRVFESEAEKLAVKYTCLWVILISVFSFGFLMFDWADPSLGNFPESFGEVFKREFSCIGTFIVMIGILFFLIFDYVIHRDAAVKDDYGMVHYPAPIVLESLVAGALAMCIFALTINLTGEKSLGYHEFFCSIWWPGSFFILYLLLIGHIRYICVHYTKIKKYRAIKISTREVEDIGWE